MTQTEIQFFWSLTEQISLDLDYTDCIKPKLYTILPIGSGGTGLTLGSTWSTDSNAIWTTSINVDTNNITITSKKLPPFYRRVLYKLLGIRWQQS